VMGAIPATHLAYGGDGWRVPDPKGRVLGSDRGGGFRVAGGMKQQEQEVGMPGKARGGSRQDIVNAGPSNTDAVYLPPHKRESRREGNREESMLEDSAGSSTPPNDQAVSRVAKYVLPALQSQNTGPTPPPPNSPGSPRLPAGKNVLITPIKRPATGRAYHREKTNRRPESGPQSIQGSSSAERVIPALPRDQAREGRLPEEVATLALSWGRRQVASVLPKKGPIPLISQLKNPATATPALKHPPTISAKPPPTTVPPRAGRAAQGLRMIIPEGPLVGARIPKVTQTLPVGQTAGEEVRKPPPHAGRENRTVFKPRPGLGEAPSEVVVFPRTQQPQVDGDTTPATAGAARADGGVGSGANAGLRGEPRTNCSLVSPFPTERPRQSFARVATNTLSLRAAEAGSSSGKGAKKGKNQKRQGRPQVTKDAGGAAGTAVRLRGGLVAPPPVLRLRGGGSPWLEGVDRAVRFASAGENTRNMRPGGGTNSEFATSRRDSTGDTIRRERRAHRYPQHRGYGGRSQPPGREQRTRQRRYHHAQGNQNHRGTDVRPAQNLQPRGTQLGAGATLTGGVPRETTKGEQPRQGGPEAQVPSATGHGRTPVLDTQTAPPITTPPARASLLFTPVPASQGTSHSAYPGQHPVTRGATTGRQKLPTPIPAEQYTFYPRQAVAANKKSPTQDGAERQLFEDVQGYMRGHRGRNASASATCRVRQLTSPGSDKKRSQSWIRHGNRQVQFGSQLNVSNTIFTDGYTHGDMGGEGEPGSRMGPGRAAPTAGCVEGQYHGSPLRSVQYFHAQESSYSYGTRNAASSALLPSLQLLNPNSPAGLGPGRLDDTADSETSAYGRKVDLGRTLGERITNWASRVQPNLYAVGCSDPQETWKQDADLQKALHKEPVDIQDRGETRREVINHEEQVDRRKVIPGQAADTKPVMVPKTHQSLPGSEPLQRVPWRPPHIPRSKFKPYDKCTRCGVYGHFERDCSHFWNISGSTTRVDPLKRLEESLSYDTESKSSFDDMPLCEKCGVSHGLWDCEYAFIRSKGPNAPKEWKPQDMIRKQGADAVTEGTPADDNPHGLFLYHPCEVCFPRDTCRFLSVRGFRTLGYLFCYLEKRGVLARPRELQDDEGVRALLEKMGLSHLAWLLNTGYFNRAAEEIRNHITEELKSVGRLLEWGCPHGGDKGEKGMGYEARQGMKEVLLLEAQKWELVRWVSARANAGGGLKQAEKGLLVKLLERLECRDHPEELVGVVRGIVVPVPVVEQDGAEEQEEENIQRGDPGMSWNCFA